MNIKVNNLSHKFQDSTEYVLKNVSFTINDGEWVSIIGHNGSGKSTLTKILVGITEYKEGEIYVGDLLLNEENIYEIRKHIGIVFQDPDNQFVATSIEDDIAFGMECALMDPNEMESIIDKTLEMVSMSEFKKREPSQLSGGQKQRAAIAGILALNKDIIIFDEATSMIDPKGRDEVIDVIKSLKEEGKTIIMITHNMEEVMLSDRAIVLSSGEVIMDDEILNVLSNEEVLTKARLEMPLPLQVFFDLKKKEYMNKEVIDSIWELASKK